MRRIALTMLTALALAGTAPAATTELPLPQGYQSIATSLTPGCGANRAAVVANLVWDIDIHKAWLQTIAADPGAAANAGDVAWHSHWIGVYQRAISMLLADC